MDGLHCERTDSDGSQPMDHPDVSLGTLRVAGAAQLLVPDADLHVRHLDNFLPKLGHERANYYVKSRERE